MPDDDVARDILMPLLVDAGVTVRVRCVEVDCEDFVPHVVVQVESTHVTSYTPSATDAGRSNWTSFSESGLSTTIFKVFGAAAGPSEERLGPPLEWTVSRCVSTTVPPDQNLRPSSEHRVPGDVHAHLQSTAVSANF